ncbi:hypothetical protein [Nonomuraea guangzhouensis]|uniref:Toxin-antitoxin system HicB family antitoxin n=1 Tax=Nonomuraea guangzhouensis TaxID=1291555 RepID=A0ABW4G4A5_9ACTN|nr:hypothetical protein [Nonomuraea guangzhouensis]
MDLAPYVDNLRRELAVAAEAGGDDARALAERLTSPLESATRLVLLEALSAAADEITRELAPGSVDVRLRGRDPSFVVTPPPMDRSLDDESEGGFDALPGGAAGRRWSGAGASTGSGVPVGRGASGTPTASAAVPQEGEEGGTSRISLRVPEQLKPRIEEAASREGLSVNAWLVRAVSAALQPEGAGGRSGWREDSKGGRRYTGWVR